MGSNIRFKIFEAMMIIVGVFESPSDWNASGNRLARMITMENKNRGVKYNLIRFTELVILMAPIISSKNGNEMIINIQATKEINSPCINVLYAFSYSSAPIDRDISEFVPLPIESPIELIRMNIGIETPTA